MRTQNVTGMTTEQKVLDSIKSIGLEAQKPKRDVGVDLEVWNPGNPSKKLCLQVKGRGKVQTNGRYRWFQIRTTKQQRNETLKDGLPICEAWRKKASLCDFFVLVSERWDEQWIFPKAVIQEIVEINRSKYGRRSDNASGVQTEMDLDILCNGKPLTEVYARYKNNFALIAEKI